MNWPLVGYDSSAWQEEIPHVQPKYIFIHAPVPASHAVLLGCTPNKYVMLTSPKTTPENDPFGNLLNDEFLSLPATNRAHENGWLED